MNTTQNRVTIRHYALGETRIDQSGLFRCCVDTVETLPDGDYPDGVVIDCKHEPTGNAAIVLRAGVWQWNNA